MHAHVRVSPASKLAKLFFPTLHSFNVVLARPRSVHLHGVVAGGATIEQCAQHVQESEMTRLHVHGFHPKCMARLVFLCLCGLSEVARLVFFSVYSGAVLLVPLTHPQRRCEKIRNVSSVEKKVNICMRTRM